MCQDDEALLRVASKGALMERSILGIDVGKRDFHCALLEADKKPHANNFPNSSVGFTRLLTWLRNRHVAHVHACLEATGGWSEELAGFLHEHGHVVSIVNAAAVKAFGSSELSRTKTDKADAALIARYCAALQPQPWRPPSAAVRRLQRLVRRRVALDEMRVQELNRLEAPGSTDVRTSIEQTIAFFSKQIEAIDQEIDDLIGSDPTLKHKKDLLESIPGIGERTSTTLLGEIPNISEFRNGKALAAFVGLCPQERRSGTSVSASWLSKAGNSQVRRVLYWPAISASVHNPILKAFAARLKTRGKRPKQIIAAVMRRLLVQAYGVLKSQTRFDPAYAT